MRVLPVDFVPTTASTAAVYRVVSPGRSVFVKILQSPRHWPLLSQVPADFRDDVVSGVPWRAEAAVSRRHFDVPQRAVRLRDLECLQEHRVDSPEPDRLSP
jgi:hypothetical protein